MSGHRREFSVRRANLIGHAEQGGSDGGEAVEDLREQVRRLTEKVADLADDMDADTDLDSANRRDRGREGDEDLDGYVAQAGALAQMDGREG